MAEMEACNAAGDDSKVGVVFLLLLWGLLYAVLNYIEFLCL